MRKQGISSTSFLLSLGVIAVAGMILFFVNRSVLLNNDESADTHKMRDIMRAIDLYEQQNDELPPPSLVAVAGDVADPTAFVSANDPFTLGTDFPVDPAFPDVKARSSFRISYTYLPQWFANGKAKANDLPKLYQDPRVGLLACYWYGDTTHLRSDGLDSKGPIVRIRMDGSAVTVPAHPSKGLLTAQDLFNLP